MATGNCMELYILIILGPMWASVRGPRISGSTPACASWGLSVEALQASVGHPVNDAQCQVSLSCHDTCSVNWVTGVILSSLENSVFYLHIAEGEPVPAGPVTIWWEQTWPRSSCESWRCVLLVTWANQGVEQGHTQAVCLNSFNPDWLRGTIWHVGAWQSTLLRFFFLPTLQNSQYTQQAQPSFWMDGKEPNDFKATGSNLRRAAFWKTSPKTIWSVHWHYFHSHFPQISIQEFEHLQAITGQEWNL